MKKQVGLVMIMALLCAWILSGCQASAAEPLETLPQETVLSVITPESMTLEKEKLEIPTVGEPFEDVEETVYVTGSSVNVRSEASTDADVVAVLKKAAELKRVGYNDKWSQVLVNDKICFVSSQYLSLTKPEVGKLIAIDPGHQAKGNSEKEPIGPGASQTKPKVASGTAGVVTGLPEYKLTLSVSLKLKEELEARGYEILMIREAHDVNISNAERAEIANNSGADIFLRIHGNSLNDSSVHGALTMCQTASNPYNGQLYQKSALLSRKVVDGLCAATGAKNRGIQETDSMSGINWCKIPVTIVEMGFMSNAQEDRNLSDEAYQAKIVKGIADGIDAYYAAVEK